MKVVDLPDLKSLITSKKVDTLTAFYEAIGPLPKGTSVTKVKMNTEDCKELEELFNTWATKHFKKEYTERKLESMISMSWLNMSPSDSTSIPKGKVHIDI